MDTLNNALMLPSISRMNATRIDTDAQRITRYTEFLRFYEGEQWLDQARPAERRLTINYARIFVLKGASYLLGRGVRVRIIDATTGEVNPTLNATMQSLYRLNDIDRLDFDVAVDAGVLGDGAFKVTMQRDGVTVRQVDPFDLAADFRDDYRTPRRVIQRHTMPIEDAAAAFNLSEDELSYITPDRDGIVTLFEHWTADRLLICNTARPDLDPFGKGESNSAINAIRDMTNPYGFVPYVIFPNQPRPRYKWGMSDLVDLIELNRELNARMSVLSQILQLSGNPILVMEGVDEADRTIRVGPGAVWTLPPDSKAYLLDMLKDGGARIHLDYIDAVYRTLHDIAEMPRSAFGDQSGASAASGVSLEFDLQPLIRKIDRKRTIWEDAITRRARMMLLMSGVSPAELDTIIIEIEWPPLLPQDKKEAVANEVALVGAGIHTAEEAAVNLEVGRA